MLLLPYYQTLLPEAGLDEAGRGCLAGPVVAAAVMLDPHKPIAGLNDSKKLSPARRAELAIAIKANALAWAIGEASATEIDAINIYKAAMLAMHRAVAALAQNPAMLLIDGNRFIPYPNLPHACFVKGDGRYQAIAAASILAKTHRDALMLELHQAHPAYGWATNKAYCTQTHRLALLHHGPTAEHRQSFRLVY